MKLGKRGAIWWDQIGWAIIALAVLAIILFAIWLLHQQGINLFDKLKDLFKFGR